jgi:antitoxin (DNA-binding transcriptional repressor) of toxin-antitoxin stability system
MLVVMGGAGSATYAPFGTSQALSLIAIRQAPESPGPRPEIATYVTYTTSMSENAMPLPYEVQEMTTTEARKHLPDLVNMAAYGHVTTVLTRDGRRLARIVPEEDAWVYSPAWQEKLREAEADLAAGRVRRFDNDEEFLGHLEAIDDEADG